MRKQAAGRKFDVRPLYVRRRVRRRGVVYLISSLNGTEPFAQTHDIRPRPAAPPRPRPPGRGRGRRSAARSDLN